MVYVPTESVTVKMDGKDQTARKVVIIYFVCFHLVLNVKKSERHVLVHLNKLQVDM